MFEIRRDILLERLFELSNQSCVLITGSPGIGKSWLLREFLNRSDGSNNFVLALSVENYQVNSLPELYKAIGLKQSISAVLKTQFNRVFLVLDGLDASRGETAQRVFRELIVDVMETCPGVTVIATIRSFDLRQSPTFSKLLTYSSSGTNTFSELKVDLLTDAEIAQVSASNELFDGLWNTATGTAKELLRNPFNLQISLLLLKNGSDTFSLRSIGSQAELLECFWQYRVDTSWVATPVKALLRQILRLMVQNRSLSIAEGDVSLAQFEQAYNELLSVELLQRSATGRLSLSHNIFFDYAVARLLLDETSLIPFIKDDSSRLLYYRPSIHFFFAHLWNVDRTLFWSITDDYIGDQSLNESAKIVPAIVISEMARSTVVLEPLLGNLESSLLKYVLNAGQTVGIGSKQKMWLDFLWKLSKHPPIEAINEILGFMSVLEPSVISNDTHLLAQVSRGFIEWSWAPGESVSESGLEQLGGVVTGRLLSSAIADISESLEEVRSFIRTLLGRVGKEHVSTGEIVRLIHVMTPILTHDPILGSEIYDILYGFVERSEDTTTFGSGSVMNLQSNRKQDYSSARYGAMVKYSALLEKDPVLAARTAVRAANEEVQQERPLSEKDVLRGFSFEVGGRVVHYVTDYSDIWDGGGGRDYTSLSLLATCLNSLPNEPSGIRTEMVDTIIRSAVVGVVWKRLVETAANHAKDMFDDVEALFHSSQFLAAPEITVSVGKLLVAVNDQGNLTKERFKPIENAILAISDETPVLRYESAESIRKRLLASVDRALLSSKAVKILSTGEPARENRPLFEVTGGAVSQLEALRIRGINPDDKDNAEILSALDPVEQFNHRFINGEVDLSDANSVLEPIKKLQGVAAEAGAKGVSNELVVRGRGALIAASAVVLRAIGLDTNSEMFQLAKDIAFAGAVDLDPVFDPRYHLPFDHPGWGGPSPRIEAAQAVVSLVWNYDRSAVALETLEALSKDKVPAVRFQIARGLLGLFVYEPGRETFWRILQQMLHEETTEGVLIGLLSTLRSVARITPERTVSFLHKLLERGLPQAKRSDSSRLALDILVGLYVWQGFAPALHELARFEANVEISQADLSQIALTAFQYISPADIEIAAVRERARELLTRVFDVAQRFSIEEGRKTTPRNLAPPAIILETIASRLFFAFDLIGTRAPNQKPMTDEQRKQLYSELGPFIDRVCQVEDEEATVPLIAQGAHYLLQLMNGILFIDPSRVLLCASAVCRHGSKTGYLMDSLAHSEAVKLVEQTVADHREILRDDKIAGAMGSMLDQFIRAGWPEAITLSFKLEDAFR